MKLLVAWAGLALSFVGCGGSEGAEDDKDSDSGEAGGGAGGKAGRGGRGGTSGTSNAGGEGGSADADAGGAGGEAGSDGGGGRGGQGNAGRGASGGAGGAGGGGGRGGGSAGKGGGTSGKGGTGAVGGGSGGASAGAAGSRAGGAGTSGDGGTAGSGSGIVTFLWGDYRESLADATSYLFEDVALGTPGPDRLVVVAAHTATNVPVSFSSLTIGSAQAQKVASVGENLQPSAPTAYFVARLPQGETADIEVVFNDGVVRAAVAVHALYGVSSITPYDSGSATSMGGATIPVQVAAGGVVLAGLAMANAANATATWAGMLELYDTVMVEGTPTHVSGAFSAASPSTMTFNVVVAMQSAGFATRALAVSFR